MMMVGKINHPKYYGGSDNVYEAIKIIDAIGAGKEFCYGNVIKYIMRAGSKPNEPELDDLKKAEWYLRTLIEGIETGRYVNAKDTVSVLPQVDESDKGTL